MQPGEPQKKKILFVMTIDTEEEWDWSRDFSRENYSVRNIRKIPKFQTFCQELGVKPTYFIDYAIVSDQSSITCFKGLLETKGCEIGAHLHPWVTPPFEEELQRENTHAVNLPLELVRRKLKNLTQKLEDAFGVRPLTFRSGRWGMNANLLEILAEAGYQTDSSVYPFYADATFSYYAAPDTPYWPDWTDCMRPGSQRAIFEIPVTSGFNRPNFRRCHHIHQALSTKPGRSIHGVGILWHLKLLRKLQLSPELADAANMMTLVNACLKRGQRMIHMFLHSSSLLPGGSPYVRNEGDEQAFYRNIAEVIRYLKTTCEVRFCTLTEAKQHYLQEEHT